MQIVVFIIKSIVKRKEEINLSQCMIDNNYGIRLERIEYNR